jgi:hypothetical protein
VPSFQTQTELPQQLPQTSDAQSHIGLMLESLL